MCWRHQGEVHCSGPLSLSHCPDRAGLSIDFVSFVSRNLYLGVVRPVFRPILGNLSISSSPPQFESGGWLNKNTINDWDNKIKASNITALDSLWNIIFHGHNVYTLQWTVDSREGTEDRVERGVKKSWNYWSWVSFLWACGTWELQLEADQPTWWLVWSAPLLTAPLWSWMTA